MRTLRVLVVAALAAVPCAASQSQDSQPAQKPRAHLFEKSDAPLPANVYCKINGLEISRAEFGDWIQKYKGDNFIQEYVLGRLIRDSAKTYNVQATPEEINQRVMQRIEERILNGYRGKKERFIEVELTNFGKTMEQFKTELAWEAENEMLVQRILKVRRLTTDADVEKEFQRLYGTSARELWLRAILIEIDPHTVTTHKTHEEIQALLAKAVEDARKEGVEVVKRIQSGAIDFASAAVAHSDDSQSKVKGGDIGKYSVHPPLFGDDFDAVIQKARVGQIVGPVRVQAGYIIAEITKETVHDLRAERDAIRKQMTERNATGEEQQRFLGQLLIDARLVK